MKMRCRWQILISRILPLESLVLPSLYRLDDDFKLDQLEGPALNSVTLCVDDCTAAGLTSISTSEKLSSLTINHTDDLQTLVRHRSLFLAN